MTTIMFNVTGLSNSTTGPSLPPHGLEPPLAALQIKTRAFSLGPVADSYQGPPVSYHQGAIRKYTRVRSASAALAHLAVELSGWLVAVA